MSIEDNDNDHVDGHLIDLLPYRGLVAYRVALDVLALADEVAGSLPRGYGPLADQLRRASQSVLLQLGEGSGRLGADRRNRYIGARAEAVEAAIATEGLLRLRLGHTDKLRRLLGLLARLNAMLIGLARR